MSIANFLWRRGVQVPSTGLIRAWRIRLTVGVGLVAAGLLAGCAQGGGAPGAAATVGSNTGASLPPSLTRVTAHLHGVVHGGQPPIGGSQISVYVAGQPASASPTLLAGPVNTGSDGTFNVPISCSSPTDLVYIVAAGGAPSSTVAIKSPIKLMAALGPCGGLPSSVVINELTTVAAVYALNAFSNANSSSSGLGGCVDCSPTVVSDMTQLHGNSSAINNSFATAALLADATTGGLGNFLPAGASCTPSATGNPVSPTEPVNCSAVQKLTALANSVAACVNSVFFNAGAVTSGPPCTSLMTHAGPGLSLGAGGYVSGSVPSDTLEATLAIARNPALNVVAIYALARPPIVFNPGLAAAPTDWTIALNFTGGGVGVNSDTSGIAIDAAGNVWTVNSNTNSLSEFSPTGVPLSPGTGYTSGSLNKPYGIAIDSVGSVWVTNNAGNSVSAFNPSDQAFLAIEGFNGPGGIAIDALGYVWIANAASNSLAKLTPAGVPAPGSPFTGGGLNGPVGLAIDAGGHVWLANELGSDVAEFSASGVPVSGTGGFTAGIGSSAFPSAVAVDASEHVWVANSRSATLTELSTTDGAPLSGANGFSGGGMLGPVTLAVDGGGNVWVGNSYPFGTLAEFNPAGMAVSPATGFSGGGLGGSGGIAIDASGDVWVTGYASVGNTAVPNSSVVEFVGAAVPVVTPLVAQIMPPAGNLTSIAVTPATPPPSITAGATQQFTATGTYANGTTANLTGVATWTSSNTAAATIAGGGLATGVAAGTTTISASVTQNGTTITSSPSGNATLTVTAATTTGANTLAIAMAGTIPLFNVSGSWNAPATPTAPTAFATVSAPGVTSVAFDSGNNLYYLAAIGTTSVSFNKCPAPMYAPCAVVGASLPAGSQWLATDTNGNGYVTETNTVIEFSIASGPSASSPVVFTSNAFPSASANFTGLAVSPGASPILYVAQAIGTNGYGDDGRLYQCAVPCAAGQQADITTQVLQATGTNATIFGPVAVGPPPASSLYVAAGNAWTNSSSPVEAANAATPIALICPSTIATAGTCAVAGFLFPAVGIDVDPFVGSFGIAVDASGNAYVAVAQTGNGAAPSAPYFFGFQSSGTAFSCSVTPSTCPVDLLPSLPALSSGFVPPAYPAYAMAIGPAGQ